MTMTRREVIASALGASLAQAGLGASAAAGAAVTPLDVPAPAPSGESLDALARRKGLRFGSAIGRRQVEPARQDALDAASAAYRELVAAQCSLIVHENELKWRALRPSRAEFRFGPADAIADWARQHQLDLRGHTLLWHAPKWLPDWLNQLDFGAQPVREAEQLITEHISTVCRRYGDRVISWDVVNESVDADDGQLRNNAFTPHLGNLGQIELAFRLAHEHAPRAQLVYNDFMTWGNYSAKHRAGVLELLQALRQRDVPVHALGLQSHIGTGKDGQWAVRGGAHERDWRRFLDEVSALGLDLLITELDVNDRYMTPDPARRDVEVAAAAREYLDVTLSYRNLRTVMAWGLADHVSWMQTWWPRADGLAKRSCPYDAQLRPKLLRTAVAEALQTAPERGGR